MGLLDDAIREHLDLKRRRGADPTEIERAEQEALGPVRRDPFERGSDDFESMSAPGNGLRAFDHEEEPYDDDEYEEYGVQEEWEEDFEDQPLEPGAQFEAEDAPEPGEGQFREPTRLMDHEALDELQPPLPDSPSVPPPYQTEAGAGEETMQYDVEETFSAETVDPEHGADWAEGSEEWEEPSHEPVQPSEERLEQPPADKAPTFGMEAAEQAPPYHLDSDMAEPGVESGHGFERPATDASEAAQTEDDALEENPESLQDTPDRDRLWFEQRPPRDPDSDG